MTVRFDEAWRVTQLIGRDVVIRTGQSVVVLRDLIGRVSLVVDDRAQVLAAAERDVATSRVRTEAGRFAAATPVLQASEMFAAEGIFSDPNVIWSSQVPNLGLLERGVVGGEWTHAAPAPPTGRVALYGFKGGVGRSTATFMLARHLAAEGRCVLVIDLDLESPGIGPLLEEQQRFPLHGVVDQLVEAAVGNDQGLELVGRSTRVRGGGNGEVWLAPSGGMPRPGYDYLAKLNRAYVDIPAPAGGRTSFAQRLAAVVEQCEKQVTQLSRSPDVVLLDSRAGLHDIAAVVLTQLVDLSFLFAADNRQTWTGYSMLFSQWREAQVATVLRERLRMVSALTPANTDEYLRSFRDHAQSCFSDHLYDDAAAGDTDAFNPAPDDEDAPHSPLPIHFIGELVGLDSDSQSNWYDSELVAAAYRDFLDAATSLIGGDPNG